MKQKKGRLIALFSIILVLCVIAGYCGYKYYSDNSEVTINEYEEEILLGDVSGLCGKSTKASAISYCKNVNCSARKNSSVCNASQCCRWTSCNIQNCKTPKINKSGQCICTECDKYYERIDGGRICKPKQSTTCCAKSSSGGYVTLTNSVACSNAASAGKHVHAGACNLCSNMAINIPLKASQDSGISVNGSNKLEAGITCSWTVKAGGKTGRLDCGAGKACAATIKGFAACTTVNVTVSGPTSKSGSVKIESKFSDTEENKKLKSTDTIPSSASDADFAGKSYYGSEKNCVTNADGTRDCQLHVRGSCDTRYNYCCVDNGTLLTSSNAVYKSAQPSKVCPANYTLLENVKKEDCVIKNDLGACDTSDIPSPSQTGNATVCEGSVSIKVDSGKKCTNTTNNEKTNFYEIACSKTIKTDFDYDNDGNKNTIRSLYKGEGFSFGIEVETTVNCKYTFYDSVWKTAYNNVMNRIKAINSNLVHYVEKNDVKGWENYINNNILHRNGINSASELFRLWGIVEELKNAVKAYNEYTPSDNYNESSKVTINTIEKGKNVSNTYELVKTVSDEGSLQKSGISSKNLNVSGVANPQTYTLKSKTPRKIKLIPARVCINKGTGKITTIQGDRCPENTIDGGNKIYTSFSTDVTEKNKAYPINIKVEGLGANSSVVINDKCDLKVIDRDYIYRPIDVKNPFINSSWQKGKNWVNDEFDFTQVIHANTWSDNRNQKVIGLTTKDIEAIKKSNSDAWKSNNSPYLGLCDSQSTTLQDEITKKLCNAIK